MYSIQKSTDYTVRNMKTKEELQDILYFVGEYASRLMGSGVYTLRVVRNIERIGKALGVTIRMSLFQTSFTMTIIDDDNQEAHNRVVSIPTFPINFEFNSELSALSWQALDEHLPLSEIQRRYEIIINYPRLSPHVVLILVGLANASFCKLFEGDWPAIGAVFIATLAGFFLRQTMQRYHINHYIVFIASACVASLCAASALWFSTTPQIALATSVLYLIPGVPLLNGVIDMVSGHVLTGFSRLVNALLLVLCTAIGLGFTLSLFRASLL